MAVFEVALGVPEASEPSFCLLEMLILMQAARVFVKFSSARRAGLLRHLMAVVKLTLPCPGEVARCRRETLNFHLHFVGSSGERYEGFEIDCF